MLPNLAGPIARWAAAYTVKAVTHETIDFVDEAIVVARSIRALTQVAQKNKLNPDVIDWSLRYLTVHSLDPLDNGEFLEAGGIDYKIIDNGDWQQFGYTEALAEEVKGAVLVATPLYVLTYVAGAGGTLTGTTPQSIYAHKDGSTVTAVPDVGYQFTTWSDGVLTAARTDLDVTASATLTASFTVAP